MPPENKENTMRKSKLKSLVSARLAALAALAVVSAAPVLAQSKMGSKMSGGKAGGHGVTMYGLPSADKKTLAGMSAAEKKLASTMPAGSKMSAAQKKTMAGMTSAEKKLARKMMRAHAGMLGAMHGGKASVKGIAMTCPHCKVALKGGKCPMCGMTAKQMKMKSHKM